mgnify:CR=1 FL=1
MADGRSNHSKKQGAFAAHEADTLHGGTLEVAREVLDSLLSQVEVAQYDAMRRSTGVLVRCQASKHCVARRRSTGVGDGAEEDPVQDVLLKMFCPLSGTRDLRTLGVSAAYVNDDHCPLGGRRSTASANGNHRTLAQLQVLAVSHGAHLRVGHGHAAPVPGYARAWMVSMASRARAWNKHGTSMARAWQGHRKQKHLASAWQGHDGHGVSMARARQEHGTHGKSMAIAWQEHGNIMARAWQEHGKSMTRA